jgi:hypothetical protein
MHPNPPEEDVSMLPEDLLKLIEVLKHSLEEEYFGFVSDEIDHVIEQPIGATLSLTCLADDCPQARSGYPDVGGFNM